jgi:hypothetical protein
VVRGDLRGGCMQVSEVRVGWRAGDWLRLGFRSLVLLVLLAGAVNALAVSHPQQRSSEELVADLAAGRVKHLAYDDGTNDISWSTDWWRWQVTTAPHDVLIRAEPALGIPPVDPSLRWLYRQVDASGKHLPVHVSASSPRRDYWLGQVAWPPLRLVTAIVWLVTLGVMLMTARHRYANRWAWFWLFTVGQVGALLYLVLEPRPIWRPAARPAPDRTPITGGTGFLWSLVLSVVVGIAVVLIGALAT